MFCAAIGERCAWFFEAKNENEGQEIANIILSVERFSSGNTIYLLVPTKGFWQVKGEEVEGLKEIEAKQIIEIKGKALNIDVIYMTRIQKERHSSPSS